MIVKQQLVHVATAVAGIFLIIFVLTISITRQTLYAPTAQEQQDRAGITVSERLAELREWPPAPDHPLYPLRMAHDQFRLFLANVDVKPLLKLELATDRLDSAKKLLDRHRTTLALTTLTKSTKYVIAASVDAVQSSPHSSSVIRGEVANAITVQISELSRIKSSFPDEQKSVIDRLILELKTLHDSSY